MKKDGGARKIYADFIASSLIFCIVGLLMIIFPELFARLVCLIIGAVLTVYGVGKIFMYISAPELRPEMRLNLVYGVVYAVIGLVLIFRYASILNIINVIVGIFLLVDGISKLRTAFSGRSVGIESWWIVALFAAASAILGLVLIIKPFSGVEMLNRFIGIALLAEGILNLIGGIYSGKLHGDNVIVIDSFRDKDK